MSMTIRSFFGILATVFMLTLAACQQTYVKHPHGTGKSLADDADKDHYKAEGMASWYGPGFHGHRTASGKRFNTNKLTAAHRTLPFGTIVLVTNLNNDKTVEVEINDRGPAKKTHREIDLSKAAAKKLGFASAGTAKVRVEVIPKEEI